MIEDYSQPNFYRFNQDSTTLVQWILKKKKRPQSILDLGAGSGIIGIELARVIKPSHLVLVEVQDSYYQHLLLNVERYLPKKIIVEILIQSFCEFSAKKFELIVCNPPYYLPGKGELSHDPKRAIARSFIKDSWEILLLKISECLDGVCYIVLKKDESLFKHIQGLTNLGIKRHDLDQLMVLELF